MPGYSFFKSEGENYGNVKSIYTRDIRYYNDNLVLIRSIAFSVFSLLPKAVKRK